MTKKYLLTFVETYKLHFTCKIKRVYKFLTVEKVVH